MNQKKSQGAESKRDLQQELIRAGALRQLRHNDGSPGFVFAYDVDITNRFLAALKAQPAPTEAQGEDSARLVDILDEIMQSAPRNVGRWAGGNAPGHCHAVAGIWDPDNGAKAGLKCGWCDVWRRADEEVRKFRARASAETGGVKS